MADGPRGEVSADQAALAAAAYAAAKAAPGPKVEHPNPDMNKFSDAIRADAALHRRLFLGSPGTGFNELAVSLAAERGLKITTAEVQWHLSESRRQGSRWERDQSTPCDEGFETHDDADGTRKCQDPNAGPDVD